MKKIFLICCTFLLAFSMPAQELKLACATGSDGNYLYNPPTGATQSSSFPKKDRSDVWTYYMKFNPKGNGFHLNIPIRYCFINCFGEMYLWVTLVTKEVEYDGFYQYNGENYLISEYYNGTPDPRPYLGKLTFKVAFGSAPAWGYGEVTGQEYGDKSAYDIFKKYTGGNLSLFQTLSEVTLSNVIDWDGFACLGQSYPMVDDKTHVSVAGMSNAELYAVIKYLSVYRIEQLEVSCKDYAIEAAIKAKLDEKKLTQDYNKTMEDAAAAFNAEDYQKALTLYQHASNLKPNESLPKQKMQECRDMIKKKKDEEDFKKYVSAGDAAAQAGNKSSARSNYRSALALKQDPDVKAKLEALGEDPVEEYLQKINALVFNGTYNDNQGKPSNWIIHDPKRRSGSYWDDAHNDNQHFYKYKLWHPSDNITYSVKFISSENINVKEVEDLVWQFSPGENCPYPEQTFQTLHVSTEITFKLTDIKSVNGSTVCFTHPIGIRKVNSPFTGISSNAIDCYSFRITNYEKINEFEEALKKAVIAAGGTLN